jgi:hypothetical protein
VVPVPHINGTRNPVPVAILQKINSGSPSENQIQFQSGSLFFQMWFWFWFWKSDLIPARFLLTKTRTDSSHPPKQQVPTQHWCRHVGHQPIWHDILKEWVSNLNCESLGTPKCVERWRHHVENNIVNTVSRDKRYTCTTIGSSTCMQWKMFSLQTTISTSKLLKFFKSSGKCRTSLKKDWIPQSLLLH